MKALTFLIELCEPLLATQTQTGEPNSSVSLSFIPGSMLRGALIQQYLDGKTANLSDSAFKPFTDLFFGDQVYFLNAYLAHPLYDIRLLPRPLSWFVPKDRVDEPDTEIYDFAFQNPGWEDVPPKPPRASYVWAGSENIQLGEPEIQVTVHNASRDRDRKHEQASQVYRYDALAQGQIFAGVILSADQTLLDNLLPLLNTGNLLLGGSITAGYGKVKISQTEIQNNWQEYTPAAQNTALENAGVVVTCLSDVIVRGQDGQVDGNLDDLAGAQPVQRFRKLKLVGGFNRKWGLPLQQEWAVQAGSVFIYPESCRPQLTALAENGIGERRIDGFGRIAIDLYRQPFFEQSELPLRKNIRLIEYELTPESKKLAARIAKRRLQQAIQEAVTKQVIALAGSKKAFSHLPKPAQISRARLAARQAWQSGNLKIITEHFDSLSELTRRSWQDARLRSERLHHWILETIKQQQDEFTLLAELPSIAGEKAELTPRLRDQAIAQLIEGVLKQAVRQAKREAEEGVK